MRVVSLIDNNRLPQRKDLRTEPGFALCVFTEQQQILFDTGVSGIFALNAQRLNVDVARVSLAVLSHHHFDHGGGLEAFFEANTQANIFLRSSTTEQLYLHLLGLFRRRIGLNESLFPNYPDRFVFVDQFSEIAPDVFILTRIEKRRPTPKGNRHLFVHTERSSKLDDFEHELILVVREKGGLVVFTGCSHHGILNMLHAVLEHFPGQSVKAVFGGFHLIDWPIINNMAGSRAEVEELGRAILEYPIGRMYTGHCTGVKAYRILREVMGARLEYFSAGCETVV